MATCSDDVQALRDEIRDLKETVATLTAIIASAPQHPGAIRLPLGRSMYDGDEFDSDGGDSPMQCVSAMLERRDDARAHLGSDW